MKKPALLSLTLGFSVCFHAGLLLFISVKASSSASIPLNEREEAFSLVNIAELEPAAPAPPRASPPAPQPLETLLVTEHEPAELYIEDEESAENQAEIEAGAEPAPVLVGSAVRPERGPFGVPEGAPFGVPKGGGERAAQTLEYVKHNYRYIQRRIRDRLVYPATARKAGIQGVVELSFTIHEDGRVGAVTVLKSSGHAMLDEAAVGTVYAASPFPRPPAPARIAIPIAFRLR
ncbi:MAG: TonB family protein [Spirochaetaceae bacterium]|jgi:protein TonB|nr:TonB family protein [Spirochaetaceae bacterium]